MTLTPMEKLAQDTENLEPRSNEFASEPGEYIRKGTADTDNSVGEGGMLVSDLETAGWTIVYHTVTREPSTINNNMLHAQMAEKLPDGTFVFTKEKPSRPAWRGSVMCFFHEDHPDRPLYASMGFAACRKSTMPSEYEANEHMRNRHTKQWKAVEEQREIQERREDRELNRATLTALSASVGIEAPTVEPAVEIPATPRKTPAPLEVGQCAACDWKSEGKNNNVKRSSLSAHVKTKHPEA